MSNNIKYLISIITLLIYLSYFIFLNGLEYLDKIITLIDSFSGNINFYSNYSNLIQRWVFVAMNLILLIYIVIGFKFKFYSLKYKKVDTIFNILLAFFIIILIFNLPALIFITYEKMLFIFKYKTF